MNKNSIKLILHLNYKRHIYCQNMKFLAGFLKGKCMQCLVDDYKSIVEICSCGMELCEKHAFFHVFEQHNRFPIEISEENNRMYAVIRTKDCSMIEGLLEILKCKSLAEMSTHSAKEFGPCMHVFRVFKEMAKIANQISQIVVYYASSECCICSLQENKWMCIACGLVFCGRNRHNIKGCSHAYKHFEKTQHSLFITLDDFDPGNLNMLAFCCFCSVFIRDEIIHEIFSCRYIARSGCLSCDSVDIEKEKEKKSCQLCRELHFNAENFTAEKRSPEHVLSIVQAISFCILSSGNVNIFNDLVIKESNCEFKNAVNEILAKMMSMHALRVNGYVFVDHIEELVNSSFERCDDDTQMDAARFFRNFMSLLKRIETGPASRKISNLFYILLRSSITCGECKEKWDRSEKVCILYLKPNQTVAEYFSIKQLDKPCKCGARTKTIASCLSNIPTILAVRLKRPANFILGENACPQIERELCIPYREYERRSDAVSAQDDSSTFNDTNTSDDETLKSDLITTDLISPDVFKKMQTFFNHSSDCTQKKNAPPKEKTSFLTYRLKTSVVYQNNSHGGYYFTQILDERESSKSDNSGLDSVRWDTYIDGEIFKAPLFKADAILLFYVRTEN
ncbi:hypothetical protein NEMIN01_1329 [Nematocida minor]|uniref:uncharacterized protein n=1 Tax=Nematocida minor TaxID=1912983 RepID=UPI0022207064|nr:uncharacterized protein NEMIN01_1329 [Nematocida minor]KAI5190996.1 hypothetical protein NEMIN01_1329 [Nematocida minor]